MRRSSRSQAAKKRKVTGDFVTGELLGLSSDSDDGSGDTAAWKPEPEAAAAPPRRAARAAPPRAAAAADVSDALEYAPGILEAQDGRLRGIGRGGSIPFAQERQRLQSNVAVSRARAAAARGDSSDVPVIEVLPLGAGCDVGRSCILLRIGACTVMLDCGVHLGHRDERRFPDWRAVVDPADVACVIVTHYHLDHCGALPMWCERTGYDGPIYATAPTRDMLPVLLHDYRALMGRAEADAPYSAAEVDACVRKVTPLALHQVVRCAARRRREGGAGVAAAAAARAADHERKSKATAGGETKSEGGPFVTVKPYYAGHTLGAGEESSFIYRYILCESCSQI
jgi:glyoxylase-like metal-dependent hydrolase (beta-lactamase superfamily II)